MRKTIIMSFLRHKVFVGLFLVATFFWVGCSPNTYVKDHPVENKGFSGTVDLKGIQKTALDYFEEKYPPEKWLPGQTGSRLVVGPVLVSREALIYLEGDNTDAVSNRAETGIGSNALVVESGKGRTLFFLSEKTSYQAQSIITEELTNEKLFRVVSLEGDRSEVFPEGKITNDKLLDRGIRYIVKGYLAVDEGTKEIQVYLRLQDTANMMIICAASAKGLSVDAATRGAAQTIMARLSSNQ